MDKFNFKNIRQPKNGLVAYTDAYWLCKNGDIEKALFFGDSPQANRNKKILEWSLTKKMYNNIQDLEIVYVEVAFIPQRN